MKNKYLNTIIFVAILIITGIVTHINWFNPISMLTFGDWYYWPKTAIIQLWNSGGTWLNFWNFGKPNIQINFYFFELIWSFIGYLGFSFDVAAKITFFIPIAIFGFLSSFVLFKRLTKENLVSLTVALFYGTTTYFLIMQSGAPSIAFVYALTPLILFLFIESLEKNRLCNWIIFVLIYWIGVNYEVRIMYIVSLIIIFYFLFFHIKEIRKYWKNLLISILLLLALSLFWLLPTIMGGLTKEISLVANRGLFDDFLYKLTYAITLFHNSWTGVYPNQEFVPQPIIWYFWIVPIFILVSLFFINNKYKKEILFFGIISLIGIFLTKQSAPPLPNLYQWLYNHFPGFNLFREASKFNLITLIGYTGLLTYGLLSIKKTVSNSKKKYLFYICIGIIMIISICNMKPLVTKEIGTLFVTRQPPGDYLLFKNFVLKEDGFFRTFWTPRDSRWGIFTNQKPRISNIDIISSEWGKNVSLNPEYINLSVNEQITEIFKIKDANELFDISSIKYVIVPIRDFTNDDDFFIYYGGSENANIREWYISELDKVEWLKKIDIGTKDLVTYENENFRPHIYMTKEQETIYQELPYEKVDFEQKNPSEYKVHLKNVSEPFYLNFSESYHPDWGVKIGNFNWFSAIFEKNYFLKGENHMKNNAGLNSFYIDTGYVCNDNNCTKNEDGSYNFDLTLYFKPQSYFYLGLIISGTTLVGITGYLLYDFKKRRKLQNKEIKKIEKIL